MTKNNDRIVPLRLQKFLARSGVASRRGSEDLMTAGRVTVNGEVVRELGSKVDPSLDEVAVDGIVVEPQARPVTLMLNKPTGYLTTMSDPQGRSCVAELVPTDTYPGLYPVGRLDNDTTGLLLFSTDGELGHNLLHPKYRIDKTYLVEAEGLVSSEDIDRLEQGIHLDDGITAPAHVVLKRTENVKHKKVSTLAITIHEGRKRQVRRMFDAVSHPVITLERIQFGPLSLGDLSLGVWRVLNEDELVSLYETIER